MDTFDPKRLAIRSVTNIVASRRAPRLARGQRFL